MGVGVAAATAVRNGLKKRFRGEARPSILFLDRSRAFFNTVTGRVTPQLADALERTALSLFWGEDTHEQLGACADVLLHETAVAWIRDGLSKCVPKNPWKETRQQYAARLRYVVADCNDCHDVEGFCRGCQFACTSFDAVRRTCSHVSQ